MKGGLFTLRLTKRMPLYSRQAAAAGQMFRIGVLQKYERVAVLDVFTSGLYCDTRHGKIVISPENLAPFRADTQGEP